MDEIRQDPPIEQEVLTSFPGNEPSPDLESESSTSIEVEESDYNSLIEHLELVSSRQEKEKGMIILSKTFWDFWLSKLFASLVSVKIWILFWVLYIPYELVKKHLISGDNYTSIIIIVAPLVVGLREFAKMKSSKEESNSGSDIITSIRNRFKI